MKINLKPRTASTYQRLQRGFTMLELGIVLALIAVLAVLAYPQVRAYVISGRTTPTANDVTMIVNALRTANANGAATPYLNLGAAANATAAAANVARDKLTNLGPAGVGAAATLTHNLGASGSLVAVAQAANPNAGDSFTMTFPTVNSGACPGFSDVLNKAAAGITVNGVAVKAFGGVYNGSTAANACTAGDTNTFVFTFQ